jgi:hypothetical protein
MEHISFGVCADNVDLLAKNMCLIKNTVALMVMSKTVCLECSAEKLSALLVCALMLHASVYLQKNYCDNHFTSQCRSLAYSWSCLCMCME